MRSRLHREHILLILLVYPVQYLVLNQQISVLGFELVVAFYLPLQIFTELLISKNKLLNSGVLLTKVDVALLITVNDTFKLGDLDPQLSVISGFSI